MPRWRSASSSTRSSTRHGASGASSTPRAPLRRSRRSSGACRTDYRLLVPLWRTDSLYHELKESHGTYEAAHDWWRDRYKVAADDLGLRPKVRDIGFHRLRANAACLIEWLRICFCQGWLGSPKRNHRQ